MKSFIIGALATLALATGLTSCGDSTYENHTSYFSVIHLEPLLAILWLMPIKQLTLALWQLPTLGRSIRHTMSLGST